MGCSRVAFVIGQGLGEEVSRFVRFSVCLTDIQDGGLHVGNLMVLAANTAVSRRYGLPMYVKYGWTWPDYFKHWPHMPTHGPEMLQQHLDFLGIEPTLLLAEETLLPAYYGIVRKMAQFEVLDTDEGKKIVDAGIRNLQKQLPDEIPTESEFGNWLRKLHDGLDIAHPYFVTPNVTECVDLAQDALLCKADDGVVVEGIVREALMNVIDDHLFGVMVVMRGIDIGKTYVPVELDIYERFGMNPPAYAHLPEIRSGGEKISKRLQTADGYRMADLIDRGWDADQLLFDLCGLCMEYPVGVTSFSDVCRHFEWEWLRPLDHVDIEETVFA